MKRLFRSFLRWPFSDAVFTELMEEGPQEGAEKFAAILVEDCKKLHAMDRYERRALSRRKFAVRAFDAASAGAGS